MVTVSDTAASVLAESLAASRKNDEDVLRVSQDGTDLSLKLGAKQEGDVVFEHQQRPVLVLEPSIAEALGDVIIDTDPLEGSKLVIKPAGHEYTN